MTTRTTLILACAALLGAGAAPLPAQVAGPAFADTLRFSLADVLEQVRAEHPAWRTGRARIRSAEARAQERSSFPDPRISVSPQSVTEVRLELLQPFRWPWETGALRGVGRREVAGIKAGVEAGRRDVLLQAAARFVDGLRSLAGFRLAQEHEALARRAAERLEPADTALAATDLAALQAQVALDEAERATVRARLQHNLNQSRLAVALGKEPATFVIFEGTLAEVAPLTTPEAALQSALATDPATLSLEQQAHRADEEARLARMRRWPSFELGPAVTLGDRNRLGVAVGINIPVWNRQRAALRAAGADKDTATAQMEVRRREVAQQVTEALTILTRTRTELALLRDGDLVRARRTTELAERSAGQGGTYALAWLLAIRAYGEARSAELELEWQAAQARVLLRSLTGSLIIEADGS
ncbi:MAG: TolC family protein [Gemmatimonadetes bacterium]|nr:TolC family protein [Gemmatimonadota bacterium]